MTRSVATATIFMRTAIFLDLIIVASIVERSYETFDGLIGTWIPFGLMFMTISIIGSLITKWKVDQAASKNSPRPDYWLFLHLAVKQR